MFLKIKIPYGLFQQPHHIIQTNWVLTPSPSRQNQYYQRRGFFLMVFQSFLMVCGCQEKTMLWQCKQTRRVLQQIRFLQIKKVPTEHLTCSFSSVCNSVMRVNILPGIMHFCLALQMTGVLSKKPWVKVDMHIHILLPLLLLCVVGVANIHCSRVPESSQDLRSLLHFKQGVTRESCATRTRAPTSAGGMVRRAPHATISRLVAPPPQSKFVRPNQLFPQ